MPKVISSFLHLFNPPPAELSPTGQNQMINNLLLLPNGAEYVGDIVNNKPCGHGKLVYSNS